ERDEAVAAAPREPDRDRREHEASHARLARYHRLSSPRMDVVDRAFAAIGFEPTFMWRVLGTVAVLVAWLLVMRLTRRLLSRTVDDLSSRFSMIRAASYVVGVVALILIARLWIQGVTGVATYF